MIVRLLVSLVLGIAVAVAVGCGNDSELIPQADAAGLQDQLDAVQRALDNGDCPAATAAANDFEQAARELPTSIDADLRQNIRSGAAKLVAEVPNDCESSSTPTQTETTPTETTQTETTPTETTPTETTPPTPTIEVPTIPETIPDIIPDGTGGDQGQDGNGTGGATP